MKHSFVLIFYKFPFIVQKIKLVGKNLGSLLFSLYQKKILYRTFHKNLSYTEADNTWFGGVGFLANQTMSKVLNLVQVL